MKMVKMEIFGLWISRDLDFMGKKIKQPSLKSPASQKIWKSPSGQSLSASTWNSFHFSHFSQDYRCLFCIKLWKQKGVKTL